MTVLTAARDTQKLGDDAVPSMRKVPLAATAKVYQGGLVCLSSGYGVAGAAGAGLVAIGRSRRTYDNSTGAAGDVVADVEAGIFHYANLGADPLTAADRGSPCFVHDDATVRRTNPAAAYALAGSVIDVDDSGVWVQVGTIPQPALPRTVAAFPIPALSSIANAGVVARYKPGFKGRVSKVEVMVTTPVTTGSKLATLTTKVAGVAGTGGVVALTSANMTPAGASVQGTDVTALDFGPTDELTVDASAVTAFVEGAAVLLMTLEPR